ncbi:hypothetical protein IQ244_17685 [Nostoc sp. LEGE 06077]|uniref:hypothetical protein n=1 Tax=Nostoc sp. LEGE 06077 TaxID=915325 RepID=UPI00187E0616|nr:hypothetical protein [Nostoc sp. LEGE 06077]MBE9208326.1 hypothetical protein [Nostoc sp. LEGE 06077]
MNSQAMINNIEQINRKPSIYNLLATLKIKVANFDVIDNQGQLVGKVRDLILDNQRRLNLVISLFCHFPSILNKRIKRKNSGR